MLGLFSSIRGAVIGAAVAGLVAGAGTFTWQEIRWNRKLDAQLAAVAQQQELSNRAMLAASERQIAAVTEERNRYEKQIRRGRNDLRRVLERLRDHTPDPATGEAGGDGATGGDGGACPGVPVQLGEDLARLAGRADETARTLALCQSTVRELVRVIESVGSP